MVVYLVTEGEYSDRCSIAVFTKEEDAKKAVKLLLGDSYHSIVIDPVVAKLGKRLFRVYPNRDSSEEEIDPKAYEESAYEIEDNGNIKLKSEELNNNYMIRLFAEDPEDAKEKAKIIFQQQKVAK